MRAFSLAATVMLVSLVVAPAQTDAQEGPSRCLAVVLPSVQGVDGSATDVAAGIRDLFVSFLNGPALRTVTLDARLPAQAAIEARQKGCERMLLTTMVRKRDGGSTMGSVLGQAAGTAVWHMPYGGAAGSMARGAAIAGAQAASTLASDTRRKDEVRLEYRIGTPDTVAAAKPVSSKAKARADGEDLLTPLVEQASAAIFAVATAK
jgi:hypothetical protein